MIRILVISLVCLLLGGTTFLGWRHRQLSSLHWRRLLAVQTSVVLILATALIPLGVSETTPDLSSRDILFVLDITYSMNAKDGRDGQSRLKNAVSDIQTLAAQASGSRFGIMTFDYHTSLYVPMTSSQADLQVGLDTLQTLPVPQSKTVMKLSDALKQAAAYEAASQKIDSSRARVVVVMSDFELSAKGDTAAAVKAAAAEIAQNASGLAVGYGRDQKINLPYLDIDFDTGRLKEAPEFAQDGFGYSDAAGNYSKAQSSRDSATGRAAADGLGGRYILAENNDQLSAALQESSKTAFNKQQHSNAQQRLNQSFSYAPAAAAACLLIGLLEVAKWPRLRRALAGEGGDDHS